MERPPIDKIQAALNEGDFGRAKRMVQSLEIQFYSELHMRRQFPDYCNSTNRVHQPPQWVTDLLDKLGDEANKFHEGWGWPKDG